MKFTTLATTDCNFLHIALDLCGCIFVTFIFKHFRKIKSRRDSRIRESRERAHSKSKRSSRSHDEPDERSKKDDPFWESKWEAMQVQEMADKKVTKEIRVHDYNYLISPLFLKGA